MKLKVTEKRIEANRKNSILGGIASRDKALAKYNTNPTCCKLCNSILPIEKKRNTFCSQSCAAIFNNTGVRRHGAPKLKCACCSKETKSSKSKYCSPACFGKSNRKYKTVEEADQVRKLRVREVSANYRAKIKDQTPIDADRKSIRNFYAGCPVGYEVDHIIPISKGGLHTLENLQYLTITENRKKSNKIL
jgi:5-methylcytosine-specific restriction endonuclease McrA